MQADPRTPAASAAGSSLEVKFDEKTKALFDNYYSKWKNIDDAFREFGLKDEPKINAVMRITKNPEMASFMRKQMEKVFEVKK